MYENNKMRTFSCVFWFIVVRKRTPVKEKLVILKYTQVHKNYFVTITRVKVIHYFHP